MFFRDFLRYQAIRICRNQECVLAYFELKVKWKLKVFCMHGLNALWNVGTDL